MKTTVHIISHSHWDREWYQSFESHRMKLIELVDNILDKAENDPEFGGFFLDGQVIAIDDYLEIRPEKRAQVEKCIREGKVQTGPWYILQDEFLTSGAACRKQNSTVRSAMSVIFRMHSAMQARCRRY